MQMLRMLLLGVGLAGALGGPYILYLAYFKPGIFPKPLRARREGAFATLVGIVLCLLAYFQPWQQ